MPYPYWGNSRYWGRYDFWRDRCDRTVSDTRGKALLRRFRALIFFLERPIMLERLPCKGIHPGLREAT